MAFDGGNGNTQFSADLRVGQAIALGQQERTLDLDGQAIEQLVQFDQGLQDDCAFFFRRCHVLGHLRQGVEVGALKVLAAVEVEQYALGDRGEERTGLDQRGCFPRSEHAHEGVLGQVGGAFRAAELASQPAGEPVVMVVVQHFDGIGRAQRGHSTSIAML